MIYLIFILNFLTMLALPVVIALFLRHRFGLRWRLFAIGAATFVLAQILHIPFNWLIVEQLGLIPDDTSILSNLILAALFTGLSAGMFEEVGRYLTYRYWATNARTWPQGLMLGAGHGGVEAILVGALGLLNFLVLSAIHGGFLLDEIPADSLQQQIDAVFNTPLYMIPLGALERVFAITAHVALSLLVMQVFTRGKIRWLLAAVWWHTLLNFTSVFFLEYWGAIAAEAALGVFALISAGLILRLRQPKPHESKPDINATSI